jgi:GMP synthase (glutamine-hydrolysing)
MKCLYIIKAGSTFDQTVKKFGDFEHMILRGLGISSDQVHIIDARSGKTLPKPQNCLAVIVTGSHNMVTENLSWSLQIEAWILKILEVEIPYLGICYGHQLLGRAMGGQVDDRAKGPQVGTFELIGFQASRTDSLFCDLPQNFPVHLSHSQTVTKLPPEACLLAGNQSEPHLAFRVGKSAWGLQFHPEYNEWVVRDYIDHYLKSGEISTAAAKELLDKIRETPEANAMLQKFIRLVLD